MVGVWCLGFVLFVFSYFVQFKVFLGVFVVDYVVSCYLLG